MRRERNTRTEVAPAPRQLAAGSRSTAAAAAEAVRCVDARKVEFASNFRAARQASSLAREGATCRNKRFRNLYTAAAAAAAAPPRNN